MLVMHVGNDVVTTTSNVSTSKVLLKEYSIIEELIGGTSIVSIILLRWVKFIVKLSINSFSILIVLTSL